jgi:hypothetical protein
MMQSSLLVLLWSSYLGNRRHLGQLQEVAKSGKESDFFGDYFKSATLRADTTGYGG